MMRFLVQFTYGLHCMNRYESPDHLMCRSSNRQCIESITSTNLNLLLPSSDRTNESIITVTRNHTQRGRGINIHIIHSHMYPHTHATRVYTHVYTHIHIYTSIHVHTHYHHTYPNTHIIYIHRQHTQHMLPTHTCTYSH